MTTQPNNTPQVPLRFLSVCSGMEAASVAWEPLGWKAVGFSEIEPFPCAILKHRFPNTPNYGSLTEYQQWPIGPDSIDLLVGGTPCQSFSVAGLRKGLADPRGNLALVFLGLADKLRPRWIVWENVPGVLSSGGGRDFGSFLGALEQLGYGWAYRVLDAQHFGVPQRRRRVFVVASLGGRDVAASVLLKPESLCWHPTKGRKKGQATAADAGSGVEAGNGCWWDGGQVSQTLDAVLQPVAVDTYNQTLSSTSQAVRSAASDVDHVGGVIQQKPIVIDRAAFNQGINAQYEPHIAESEVMDSLVARGPHAVGQPICFEPRSQDGHAMICGGVSPTLNTAQGGQRQPCVAITSQPGNLRREAGADPSTTAMTTLKASAGDQMPHVACFKSGQGAAARSIGWSEEVSPTLPSNAGGNTAPAIIGTATQMAVRRLTPTECERLQGFPDNWSRIPWKGKPEDQCPDGPRYKACGNSMAVPVMRWIGEQIARVELSHNPTNQTNA